MPVGRDTHSAIYVLDWAIRGALMFGGHKKGEWQNCLRYTRERIFAFGITFGPIPDDWYAVGAAAIVMGFPVISDHESTPEVRPTGVTTYEELVRQTDHKQIVPTCIQVRGVKVKVEEIDIPVSYAPAFEGERVRREDMHVQFGGKYSDAVEVLESAELDEITDGEITVHGPDVDTVRAGRRRAAGRSRPGRRAENEDRLRGDPRAADAPLLQPRHGLHAHRPARPDLVPLQQDGRRVGLPPQAHRHDPPRQTAR